MKNIDSIGHVTGKSVFLDDIPVIKGSLHAVVFASSCAHGIILDLDISAAIAVHGVIRIFTYQDIPGENQIGGIIPDEPLLAEGEVHFIGQPIAVVVAETEASARKARKLIRVEYEELPVQTDPREAFNNGDLLFPPRVFQTGDIASIWSKCDHIFEGRAESGGQEHLYLETQGSYAYPTETGNLIVHSSTQGPSIVQKIVARVLGMSMHKIELDVRRLGGAFGGKEDQATPWAVMAAMTAQLLQKPVKLVLSREDDLYMTGKRHPYTSDFKIGLSKDFKILALELSFFQNGGASADLSPAILERSLFHATNSYFIPNVKASAYSCKTNLPPNTAFRGFGAPQAMFVMEAAIAKAANELRIPSRIIQENNLIRDDQEFPYGQIAKNANAVSSWKEAFRTFDIEERIAKIEAFNRANSILKKGMAMMPICFGISFTKTPMNQARALVHIYQDGSIGISTGAVEMGQGVNTKMKQVAAKIFSVDVNRIKLETTNTTRVANTSPTAASSGADLNGKALQIACLTLLDRLKGTARKMIGNHSDDIEIMNEMVHANGDQTSIGWENLIETAFLARVNLSENGHYATPLIHFDKTREKGHPFTYHVYGTALLTVTLDCIRGRYHFDGAHIVHDFGKSMNSDLDTGQVEGAVVQGIGWMTLEEVRYDKTGKLLSNSLSTYKVPDIYTAPAIIECKALETEGPELAIMKSKAIGEPPFMYGIGAFFALQNAIKSFNPEYDSDYTAPLTPERVLLALYS
ncbi:MAG: molybdopterin cofactor-binding domain-containing protein [Bacteroidota bacterium]|nr:molybdopterin cofactor-binding domain-containing protein [Bacteroidota bacterium]